MNTNKYSFTGDMYNPNLEFDVKGFISQDWINDIYKYYSPSWEKQVLSGMEFRPDLISKYYYGTEKLSWLIMLVSDIRGIDELILFKPILVPDTSTLNIILK